MHDLNDRQFVGILRRVLPSVAFDPAEIVSKADFDRLFL